MDIIEALDKAGQLKTILTKDVQGLADLFDRLEAKWQDIVAKAKGIRKPIADAASAVELFDAINADLNNADVKKVFDAAGAGDLLNDLRKAAGVINDKVLSKEVRLLLLPLGKFEEIATGTDSEFPSWSTGNDDGCIRWNKSGNLLSKTASVGAGTADFRLGGAVTVECEAGALWFYADDKVPSKGLLRIGVEGALTGSADGKIPAPFGQVGLNAAAGVGCQAHLFWCKTPEHIYAAALFDVLKDPVDLYSLDRVWTAMRSSGFVGAILAIDGHASLDVNLALARDFGAQGVLSAKVGLTVKVDVKRKAAYELSILKTANGVRLVLSHGSEDADNWSVGAGIEIDPGPLTHRIADIISEAKDYWDKALATITPFLSPGTWLQTEAATELNGLLERVVEGVDPVVADALRRDLRLALGHQSTEPGLADALKAKLTDVIACVEGAVTGLPRDVTDKVIGQLKAKLPSLLSEPLAKALTGEVDKLVAKLKTAFDREVENLAKTPEVAAVDAALTRLENNLTKIGTPVAAAAGDLDRRAARIRAAVAKADKLVQELAKAAQDAAVGKISARLSYEKLRIERESYEFAAEIRPGQNQQFSDDMHVLYQSLLTGKLQAAARYFETGMSPPADLVLYPDKCSVQRFSKVGSKLGYEVVLLGLELSGTSEASGQADVILKLNGDISVKSQAIAKRAASIWGDGRSSNFVQSFSTALRSFDAGRRIDLQRGMTLDLTTERSDLNLTAKEVGDYLALMVRMKLVSDGRVQRMKDYVNSVKATRGSPKLQGTINIGMSFSADEVGRLVNWGNGIGGAGSPADRQDWERKAYDFALGNLLATGEWKRDEFIHFAKRYFRPTADFDLQGDEELKAGRARLFDYRTTEPKSPPESSVGSGPRATLDGQLGVGRRRWLALRDFEQILVGLAAIWNAQPAGLGTVDAAKWDEKAYRSREDDIARYALEWLGNSSLGLNFAAGADQFTVALMYTLAGLSGGKQKDGTYDPMFAVSLVLAGEAKGF
ncbi:MAG: hypothetical protein JF615_04685 [Asticcacaulis sp.]|nr:hypothetical protein [Asticcacaulis sp.]